MSWPTLLNPDGERVTRRQTCHQGGRFQLPRWGFSRRLCFSRRKKSATSAHHHPLYSCRMPASCITSTTAAVAMEEEQRFAPCGFCLCALLYIIVIVLSRWTERRYRGLPSRVVLALENRTLTKLASLPRHTHQHTTEENKDVAPDS